MNEKLKALSVGMGLILLIAAVLWYVGRAVHDVSETSAKSALSLEGRRLLYQMQQKLKENFENNGSFVGPIGNSPMKTERYGAGFLKADGEVAVWWGETAYKQYVQELCPDCRVEKEKYKLIAIGNADEDSALDVWIQTSDSFNPAHLKVD